MFHNDIFPNFCEENESEIKKQVKVIEDLIEAGHVNQTQTIPGIGIEVLRF